MTAIRYNAALVRYQGGHIYLDLSGAEKPRELYIEMGGVPERSVALSLTRRILALYQETNTTVAIQGEVRTTVQIPGVGYQLGDFIAGQMIRSYSIDLSGDGLVQVTPELDDRLARRQEILNRQVQRAGAGMQSEYGKPNIVGQEKGSGTDTTPSEFSLSGAITATFSEAWRAPRPYWMAWLDVQLVTAGTSATKVGVYREVGPGWVLVASAVIATGATRGLGIVNAGWDAGERLVLGVSVAGTGAADLTATPRGVMV